MKYKKASPIRGAFMVIGVTAFFATLKLCGIINWSWWLVFFPILLVIGIALIVVIIFLD